jgi:hypothetical protein
MHVLSARTFRFVREGKDDVIVHPSPNPQLIPDDVADDPYFAMVCGDGSLKKIEVAPPAPADLAASEDSANGDSNGQPPAPPDDKSGPASDKAKKQK